MKNYWKCSEGNLEFGEKSTGESKLTLHFYIVSSKKVEL